MQAIGGAAACRFVVGGVSGLRPIAVVRRVSQYRPMRVSRATLIFCGISLAVALLASVAGHQAGYNSGFRLGQAEGWQAGENRFDREWSKSSGDPAFLSQIRDAKLRWNRKTGRAASEIDPNRIPVVMAFSDQVCVQLKLSSGSLGPSPAYCYRGKTTELLKADDGGE